MKRRGPAFGHVQAEYQLGNIFRRVAKEFKDLDEAREKIEKEYRTKKEPECTKLLGDFFSLQEKRTEAGVILLMTAGAFLEQIINDYAQTFLDAESYEEHLGNVRTVTKWMLLPRICQNKEISESDPAINALREFVKARNAVVHHKRQDFDLGLEKADRRVKTEIARFLSACRNATTTVDNLIKILTSPPTHIS
jgi:hypothetical protein